MSHFVLGVAFFAMGCQEDPKTSPVSVYATARALNETTVTIKFSHTIDQDLTNLGSITVTNFSERIPQPLVLTSREISDSEIILRTEQQEGGALYSVNVSNVSFANIEQPDGPSQVNFTGFGTTSVFVRLDTRGFILESELRLLTTIDAETGVFREELQTFTFEESVIPKVYTATLTVQIDPLAQYAIRVDETSKGTPVTGLVQFTASSTNTISLDLECELPREPEFSTPLDSLVGNQRAPVRIIVDDRFARELISPKLRLSLNDNGEFDIGSTRIVPLRRIIGYERVYEATVEVAVDSDRRLDGTTEADFPYIAFLVESGEDFPARGIQFIMDEEQPQTHIIPMANPNLVPVTFRVDAGSAWLEPDGSARGLYPGEGLFLTGEFPAAEDAFGRIAADAFTGGERVTLRMKPRSDAPSIFEKTVFMKPDRPYGWKVVRCPAEDGCAGVNRRVTSSGRAFPTVMKNLVTENIDAASNPNVLVIDPNSPQGFDNATVSTDGTEEPSNMVLFKQEIPDLVVTVERDPIITPIFVVGTWRDVNIPTKPVDLVEQGGVLDLNPFDYDAGWIGTAPLQRDRNLPIDPGPEPLTPGTPEFKVNDGKVDSSSRQWTTDTGRLPLWIAYNELYLYVATQPATAGSDHFIFVTTSTPTTDKNMPWAKMGQLTTAENELFLAMEGDGDFHGWFQRSGTNPANNIEQSPGSISGAGEVLEGYIDLVRSGSSSIGKNIWVAVVAIDTNDGGNLQPSRQTPVGNGDFKLDADEFLKIPLSSIRAIP
ncbi:MAG: hypothetical protein VYC39_11200 [Myxococcota bacterium]|nr:hypothetical protein [Myxococcota bacterium]